MTLNPVRKSRKQKEEKWTLRYRYNFDLKFDEAPLGPEPWLFIKEVNLHPDGSFGVCKIEARLLVVRFRGIVSYSPNQTLQSTPLVRQILGWGTWVLVYLGVRACN